MRAVLDHPAVRVGALVLAWISIAVLVTVSLSRVGGFLAPPLLQGLQATVPYIFLPVWPTALLALFHRRWYLAGAAVFMAVVHVLSVLPATGSMAAPPWAESAPTFSLLVANAKFDNPSIADFVERVSEADADVLAIVEATPDLLSALETSNRFEDYTFRHERLARDAVGLLVWGRVPFAATNVLDIAGSPALTVRVQLGGRNVQVVTVHPLPPLGGLQSVEWEQQLDELADLAEAEREAGELLVMAGDFNATRWQPPFGDLLAVGMRDAHELTGRGLSRSWPSALPIARFDRALLSEGVFPMAIEDFRLPGSDHRGFVVTLALR